MKKIALPKFFDIGIEGTDSLLKRKGKRIFNFDIICGLFLPIFSELLLRLYGLNTFEVSMTNFFVTLFFLPSLILIFLKKYDYSVMLFQWLGFIIIIGTLFFANNLFNSLFFIILALNSFIYFPEKKKVAAQMFLFFFLSGFLFFFWEIQSFHEGLLNEEYLFTVRIGFSIFAFLLGFKAISLVSLYWTSLGEKQTSQNALVESENRYRSLFENAMDGISIFDLKKKKFSACNQKMLELFGMESEQQMKVFPNKYLPDQQSCGTNSLQFIEKETERLLKVGKTRFTMEAQKKDGSPLVAEVKTFSLPRPNNHLSVSIFKDITEQQKQAATIQKNIVELNQKNIDLQKYIESNMELENFAYIASHDLKAPIRTIGSFSKLLKRRAANKLDKSELEFLDFINNGAENMQTLVEDLLTFSKVNTENHHPCEFNLPNLLEIIENELSLAIRENRVEIKYDHIPTLIYADKTKLRQLFQNLIANAIKFKKADTRPLIQISAREDEDYWYFSVRDNGIGIKKQFHDKVFMLFRRLHGAGDYEGSGIGLSICKKIVEHHFGSMSVDSELGTYTQFDFGIRKY